MTVNMPRQCFIDGKFVDAENRQTYDTINPSDGTVREENPTPVNHPPAPSLISGLFTAVTSSTR